MRVTKFLFCGLAVLLYAATVIPAGSAAPQRNNQQATEVKLSKPFGELSGRNVEKTSYTSGAFSVQLRDAAQPKGQELIITGIKYSPTTFDLLNPSRIVIDIPGENLSRPGALKFTTNPVLRSIRVGAHEDKIRIVLDLRGENIPAYQLMAKGAGSWSIAIAGRTSEVSPPIQTAASAQDGSTGEATQPPNQPGTTESIFLEKPTSVSPKITLAVDSVDLAFQEVDIPVNNIVIKNQGKTAALVTSTVDLVDRPGFEDESEIPSTSVLISPKRIVLAPGESKTVRVLLKAPSWQNESVYRVTFAPSVFEELDEVTTQVQSSGGTGIAVLISLRPRSSHEELSWVRDAGSMTLTNNGNTSIQLESGRACSAAHSDSCRPLPERRLYPGNSWTLAVTSNTTVEFVKKVSGTYEPLRVPPLEG